MRKFAAPIIVGTAIGVLLGVAPVLAAGNLASGGETLELKIDTENLKFSQNEFDLETASTTVWTSASMMPTIPAFMAPELWRNS